MSHEYDAIVVGGGHNGLTNAAYLAKAGLRGLKAYTDKELRLSAAFGNPSLPTTILYDSSGKEMWRMIGGMDWTSPTARELLAEAK